MSCIPIPNNLSEFYLVSYFDSLYVHVRCRLWLPSSLKCLHFRNGYCALLDYPQPHRYFYHCPLPRSCSLFCYIDSNSVQQTCLCRKVQCGIPPVKTFVKWSDGNVLSEFSARWIHQLTCLFSSKQMRFICAIPEIWSFCPVHDDIILMTSGTEDKAQYQQGIDLWWFRMTNLPLEHFSTFILFYSLHSYDWSDQNNEYVTKSKVIEFTSLNDAFKCDSPK